MFMSRVFVRLVGVALLALALPVVVLAQSGSTRITGVVKDSSGAPVPGAVVKVVNEASGAAIEFVTDAQGAYATDALTPAAYRVEVVLDGFGTALKRIALAGGQRREWWCRPGASKRWRRKFRFRFPS
jgi:hypothetical protein